MDHPQESAKSGLKIFGWNMEIVIAVLLSFVAIVAIIASRKFPGTGLATDIGSARFPLIYSIVLVVLCVILISQNLAKRKHTPNEVTASDVLGAEVDAEAPNYRRTFFGVVSSVFCLGAMDYFGYLLTTTIYLSFLMWLLGKKHKLWNPMLAVSITGILYFTFSTALNVPLPVGSLFY